MSKKYIKQIELYKTSDLALAAAISLFYPLEALDRHEAPRVHFLFKKDNSFDKTIEGLIKEEIKLGYNPYFSQLKFLKSRLYEVTK